jgi:hypothetical protein
MQENPAFFSSANRKSSLQADGQTRQCRTWTSLIPVLGLILDNHHAFDRNGEKHAPMLS